MGVLDEIEIQLLLLALYLLGDQIEEVIQSCKSALAGHIREQRRLMRALPEEKKRVPWTHFKSKLKDTHFRRMFRMNDSVFTKLCSAVCEKVGIKKFMPEACLMNKKEEEEPLKRISGEVKMAMSIRLLAGGSYLDLAPLFDVTCSYLYVIFDMFISWILLTLEFPLVEWPRNKNWTALEQIANSHAEKSNGIFYGVIGSLDGLAIRIRSPTGVPDPGDYCCRKGFYALNVQAMCDRWKRFLWAFPSNKGSAHDSAAFSGSRLVDMLQQVAIELFDRGLFIVGDSACGLTPYLLVPYDISDMKDGCFEVNQSRDAFNFYSSSCRIHVECAFGELITRWGLFWRTLLFDLKKCSNIVQVGMLLQNFIIENREDGVSDKAHFKNFKVNMSDPLQQRITGETGETPTPLVTDNNEPRGPGGRTLDELELARKGNLVRERLTNKLAAHEMKRPMYSNVKYNSSGHMHMTD